MPTSNNALEELVKRFTRESCGFLNTYLQEGGKYLDYMENIGVKAKTIDGYIALQFRNWLEALDGIFILFSSNSIRNTLPLTRNMFEIFIQFRYFFSDCSQIKQKMGCYLIVSQYKKIESLRKYINTAKETREDLLVNFYEIYKYTQEEYELLDFGEDGRKYKKAIEKVSGNKNWYEIYDSHIRSIRKLVLNINSNDQDKLDELCNLIYGQLSCHIHGFHSDDGFFVDKEKMKFAPLRTTLGGSYTLNIISVMFVSIIGTLKEYYKNEIDFEKLLDDMKLKNQSALLARIGEVDGLILQQKINESCKGNII